MVAPRRKGWLLPPRVAGVLANGPGPSRPGNCGGVVASEGKDAGTLVGDGVQQPKVLSLSLLAEGEDGNEAEVWCRFREAGFVDETVLHRREREALVQRISELEKESISSELWSENVELLDDFDMLYQYQYHMGHLLIEKKNMSAKYEKQRQEMSEEVEIKRGMQAAHLVSVSEFEKQEENMKRVMGLQRQSIVNLENVLSAMHAQTTEVKLEYLKKLSEVHMLEATAEEKPLEIKGKLHSLDAILARVSRRSAEIDRSLEEVEAREFKLHKISSSFITQKGTSEKDAAQQKQDLHAWEKELKDNQKRLAEWHSLLSEREMEAHGRDSTLKNKEKQLDEARKTLKIYEDSIKLKEEDLYEVLAKQEILEKKEKELLATKDQLSDCNGERVDVQKTTDYHNSVLESQRKEFVLENEEKRRDVDEQLEGRINVMAHKETVLENSEREILKKELDLEREMRNLKDREEEHGMVLNALKETTTSEKELRQQRIKHEKEWELLGERRSWRHANVERSSKNNMEVSGYIQMDEESSTLDTSTEKTAHQKINASEVLNIQTARIADDIDVGNMQRNQEQVNRSLQEEDIDCNGRSNTTVNTCIVLNNIDESKMLQMREQEYQLKNGKTEVIGNNNEVHQTTPIILSHYNKDQVHELSNRCETFLGSSEELKSCRNCGFKDGRYEILLVESAEVSEQGTCPGSAKSEEHLLCMQRCSRLMEFSHDKRAAGHSDKSDCLDGETLEHEDNLGPGLLLREVNTSQWVQSASGTKCNREPERLNKDENAAKDYLGIPDNSANIFKLSDSLRRIEDRDGCFVPPGLDSVPLPMRLKQRDRGGRRRSVFVKKSRSVNALIADDYLEEISQSKHFEGSTPKEANLIWTCFDEGYSYNGDQEAVKCPSIQQGMTSTDRGEYTEGHSEDILQLGNSSGMETSPGMEILGLKRYNYRHSTIVRVSQALTCRIKRKKAEEAEQPLENKVLKVVGYDDGEGAQRHTSADEDIMHQ